LAGAAAPAGTTIFIGLEGNAALTTSAKPSALAAALKSMLYLSGLPEGLLYVRLALVVPLHTAGLTPGVIAGIALTITLIGYIELTQPVALLLTVRLPVYVVAAAPAGIESVIDPAGKTALITSANPAALAPAL
jgi:hypothetical protein